MWSTAISGMPRRAATIFAQVTPVSRLPINPGQDPTATGPGCNDDGSAVYARSEMSNAFPGGESLDGLFHHKTEAVDSKSTGS